MPVTTSYPGVYVEEIPSGVRTIAGVSTSVTAFVGRALRGPTDTPVLLGSFEEFERTFGGLWLDSTMSYAVRSFFGNGGGQAIVVRVAKADATPAAIAWTGGLSLLAKSAGKWGARLRVRVEHLADATLYTLRVRDTDTGVEERFIASKDPASPRFLPKVLVQSSLVKLKDPPPADRPAKHQDVDPGADPLGDKAPDPDKRFAQATGGADGGDLSDAEVAGSPAGKTGVHALRKLEGQLFNLLNLPPLTRALDVGLPALTEALNLCVEKRAFLIVDAPMTWGNVGDAVTGIGKFGLSGDPARNAAVYFPRLRMPDPLQEGRLDTFAPGGAVAGVMARTDQQRGVWKAPAGQDASLTGVPELTLDLTDLDNGRLNPLGLNCLRAFPVIGRVVWGARTLRGADALGSEWKYVPIRRLALFLEESLYRGTQWVVFEPNDEPLWGQIRLNVGAFLQGLFRQGAFQGRSPAEAYFVKCDKETTPQADINLGIVNIVVGFAPLKPAEFVILKIQQIAGQIDT